MDETDQTKPNNSLLLEDLVPNRGRTNSRSLPFNYSLRNPKNQSYNSPSLSDLIGFLFCYIVEEQFYIPFPSSLKPKSGDLLQSLEVGRVQTFSGSSSSDRVGLSC